MLSTMNLKRVLRHWLSIPKADHHMVPDIYGRSASKMTDIRSDTNFLKLADSARANRRTLLYYDRLHTIYQSLRNLDRLIPKNEVLRAAEIGVYKGGGSYFISSVLENLGRQAEHFAVDTFEGHSVQDLPLGHEGGHVPKQFDKTDFEDVQAYLARFPTTTVIKGRIQDAAKKLGPSPFHFLHLDMDIYEPTLFALNEYVTRMGVGGVVVIDDYGFTTCPGIKKAVDEYLETTSGFLRLELLTGQCILIKLRDETQKEASV